MPLQPFTAEAAELRLRPTFRHSIHPLLRIKLRRAKQPVPE
jgi:hypothetical protein